MVSPGVRDFQRSAPVIEARAPGGVWRQYSRMAVVPRLVEGSELRASLRSGEVRLYTRRAGVWDSGEAPRPVMADHAVFQQRASMRRGRLSGGALRIARR